MNIFYFNGNQKDEWDGFVAENAEDGGLLQSWDWGDFQKKLNKKIWRIGIKNDSGELLTACFAFKDDLALGKKTIEVYRGPIIAKSQEPRAKSILEKLLEELRKIAREEKAMVVRIDFGIKKENSLHVTRYTLQELGLRRAGRDIQPRSTLFLDLKKSKEEIMGGMKSKHRYNIRLADKRGVKVKISLGNKEKDFSKFWHLIEDTSKRDNFSIHDKNYYSDLIENKNIKLYLAEYKNKMIAGAVVGCFGKVCVYMHGASDNEFRNVMAPYLLQWQGISDAKDNGFDCYDFGGLKSDKETSASQKGWDGITKFKKGFFPEGELAEYLGLWEMPVKKFQYYIYQAIRKIKKIIK